MGRHGSHLISAFSVEICTFWYFFSLGFKVYPKVAATQGELTLELGTALDTPDQRLGRYDPIALKQCLWAPIFDLKKVLKSAGTAGVFKRYHLPHDFCCAANTASSTVRLT